MPGLGLIAGPLPAAAADPEGSARRLERAGAAAAPSRLLDGIADGAQVYFTHSYAADITAETVATTTHAAPFASVVERRSCSACSSTRRSPVTSGCGC